MYNESMFLYGEIYFGYAGIKKRVHTRHANKLTGRADD